MVTAPTLGPKTDPARTRLMHRIAALALAEDHLKNASKVQAHGFPVDTAEVARWVAGMESARQPLVQQLAAAEGE